MAPLPPSNSNFTPPTLPSNYILRPVTISQSHQISARTKTVLSILSPSSDFIPQSKTATSITGDIPPGNAAKTAAGKKNADAKSQVTIVALTAPNPRAAGKLISIVEIVKRELESRKKASEVGGEVKAKGGGWWQYTQLKSVVQEVPRERKREVKAGGDGGEGGVDGRIEKDDEEEEDAFEVMDPAKTNGKRKREGAEFEKAGEVEQGDSTTKKRAMPVLTVYLSTAPVKELRMAFGEQT
ncbi:hypothetical protein TI39_contig4258g00008 [Zymoseptoria brevis]|uniref:DNA/RNA-binding protein Alba-like domain-containing protein n=1 Tax=Zymoseptoria brevis TaxID=1047168 RepID=A0A0F4GC38_9PEZI|nr:hypothetical protein TI39_contig4258g00008 [Zymoseptoria brevis]